MNKSQNQEPNGEGRVIGMDVHPTVFSASALNRKRASEAKVLWTHDKISMSSLSQWAKKNLHPSDIVVMEAGSNSFETCASLQRIGLHCVVLESYQASKVGQHYLKNDRVDSIKLARVYLSGLAREVWQPDEKTRVRREILGAYKKSVCDTTRSRNRINSFLTGFNIKRPKGLRLTRASGQQWVLNARTWDDCEKLLLRQFFSDLRHHDAKRRELAALMAEEVMADAQLCRLLTLCGLRHITVFAIAAVVGDISRFRNPKKLVAYIGLNPRVHASGDNSKDGRLVRHGRGYLRSLLTQGAQAILRLDPHDNPLARWGQKLTFRKCKQTATIAVARKMITSVWYILRGFASTILCPSKQLVVKIQKIGRDIGKEKINALGYNTITAYAEKKASIIMQST